MKITTRLFFPAPVIHGRDLLAVAIGFAAAALLTLGFYLCVL